MDEQDREAPNSGQPEAENLETKELDDEDLEKAAGGWDDGTFDGHLGPAQ